MLAARGLDAREDAHRPRSLRSLLVGLVAALALLAPASAGAASPRDLAAVALHPWRLDTRTYLPYLPLKDPALRERTFLRLQALGIRRARIDVKWSDVQPNPLLPLDWSELEATVRTAGAHGVSLEPIVAYTPGWANGNRGPWVFPTDPGPFRSFMAAALRRFPQIPAWEIWNEPNLKLFSEPRPDAVGFVKLLRAAGQARASVGSHATLVSGGLSPGGQIKLRTFAEQIARLGAFNYVDVLGVHPYSQARPDTPGTSFLELPAVHASVSRLAGRNIDLWITEYGDPRTSEQGPRLARAFALASGWPWLRRLTWYSLRDDCSLASRPDCHYGLLREDFSPKPAWTEFAAVLGGRLPLLATSTSLRRSSRRVRRHGRRVRLYKLRGTLFQPGAEDPGTVSLRLRRRYRGHTRRRQLTATVHGGRFAVEIGRLRPGRWRFRASFSGSARHTRSASRLVSLRIRAPRRK